MKDTMRASLSKSKFMFFVYRMKDDRLCGLVVTVPGYISRDPSSIPGATMFTE
jgi:hypothetical protein